MQIIVCKLVHLLFALGNSATKPKPGAVAGTSKMLRHAGRIMKLTAILLLGACLQAAAAGYGQKITLSEKDVPIEKVLKKIQQQTDYKFLYTSQLLEGAAKVTVIVKDAPVEKVLDLILKDRKLDWEVNEKTVIIRPRKEVTVKQHSPSFIKDPIDEVRGVITDESGMPAQNVNVVVKGTSKGTTTNLRGEFLLRQVPENAILQITSIGFDRQEIVVKNNEFLSVKLKIAVGNLDEAQVIAYGTTSRRFSTGNVGTVKAADIEKQPVNNPLLALQGRVTGIEVNQLNGLPGGAVKVRIQGQNSIRNGLDPLIVIDGVPFFSQLTNSGLEGIVQQGSPLNYLNPSDIESIDILKDADATAIYGSRAANGAILITTKKGKAGHSKFNMNLQQGWANVTRKANLLNLRQYLDMRYEALNNDGIDLDGQSTTDRNYYDLKVWDTTRSTDWQKELISNTAHYSNITAGVSGGTNTVQYLINGTYKRQTTVFPGSFDDKSGGLHFNFNGLSINQKFSIGLTGSYFYDQNHLPNTDFTSQIFLAPNAPALYNADGTLNWEPDAAGKSTWSNPLANLQYEYNNTTRNLVSNLRIAYKILPSLQVSSGLGYTNQQSDLTNLTPLGTYKPEDRIYYERHTDFANRNMNSFIIEPQISYSRKTGKNNFNGLLGATWSRNTSDVLSFGADGFSNDQLMKSPAAAKTVSIYNSSAFVMSKYTAMFGRLTYNWDEKYLINLTARRDGSSRFGDKNKFHNFWSVGLGWIFSQDDFVDKYVPFLSYGKLRASYGTTGNDQIADYSYLSLYYNSNTPIPYQDGTGLAVGLFPPNPYLQWELTHKLQAGLDLGFFNDRIILNATYARNRSSNQLIQYAVPSVTGFTSMLQNFPATIQNTSWEFMLSTVNLKNKNLQWTSTVNLTIPKNKLISFPNIESTSYASGNLGVIVGQPLGVVKVLRYVGVDNSNGLYLVQDKNGNTTSNPNYVEDRTALATPITKYYGGLLNSVSYKGFQLDFLIQLVRQISGRDLYYYGYWTPGGFIPNGSNQPHTILERWQKAGDNKPIARYTTGYDVALWPAISDVWYNTDASYIRLKNVSLSWQIPAKWLKKTTKQGSGQSARIYFSGQNLATITNYTGLDPETRSALNLPPLQLWTIGLNLEL
ncbi:hypothetical protein A4H97_22905 [Niastella yeongjuensis]|uniref:Secretin/TonB short N-terminal domain-containing protein n=1 Tax=Niastella yeongjuensis TaxID=354355 RepID=A0A1V9F7Z6_9BACT|nr:SusC/RagA family TonB-linked outer membrane protein [Niastella yeongjuensis]OQP54336.1 hypothetical protein A4H97_22905 [Niastella yeongjuensis]SEP29999.1 TonB-linked outer membrane protein, SusC/RagA family [Niastella yeongjuensis]